MCNFKVSSVLHSIIKTKKKELQVIWSTLYNIKFIPNPRTKQTPQHDQLWNLFIWSQNVFSENKISLNY